MVITPSSQLGMYVLCLFVSTGDLGNLDALDSDTAAKLPNLMKLKKALYSPEFRQ